MKITIAQRFSPFSHAKGSTFLLPKSTWAIRVYPTRLEYTDLEGKNSPFFIDFSFVGPIGEFTGELDLERGVLRVFGKTKEGYMRYVVERESTGISLTIEKTPKERVSCSISSLGKKELAKGESILIPVKGDKHQIEAPRERLSLGMHKAQEWESICRRLDFKEIFPLWLRLAAWIPHKENRSSNGNGLLLSECQELITKGIRDKVLAAFERFFLAAFSGLLVPRLIDTEYQGILPSSQPVSLSPLPLLTEGGQLIRSLFIQEREGHLAILPCLPPSFHSGRMTSVQTAQGIEIALEWTKGKLRRMELSGQGEISLKLPKGIRSCRGRTGRKGFKHFSLEKEGLLKLSLEEQTFHLDRFTS